MAYVSTAKGSLHPPAQLAWWVVKTPTCGTKSWTSFSQIFQCSISVQLFLIDPFFLTGCVHWISVYWVTIHFYQQSIYLEEEETKKSRDESVTAPAVWEFSICSSLAWMVLSWWVPCTWPARLWAQWDGSRKPSSGGWPRTRPSAWASSKRQPCNDRPERWTTLKQMIHREVNACIFINLVSIYLIPYFFSNAHPFIQDWTKLKFFGCALWDRWHCNLLQLFKKLWDVK